jgi:glycosyltransferase involved in cell wall biosynthesis
MIVVDDGSSDRTATLVEEAVAVDRRIQLLRNSSNRGIAASLNTAFARSSGELIARMDGDDRALATRLAMQVAFLREQPSIDVLGTAAWRIDAAGERAGLYKCRTTHEEIAAHIYKENPFIHPSVMMRRHFFESLGGYDETFRRAQDYDLWLRGYRTFRYHNLSEALLEYRMPQSMTWLSSTSGARAILSASLRDRSPLRGAYYASRVMIRLGMSFFS